LIEKLLVDHADSILETLETLDSIFCRPGKQIQSIMEPVEKMNGVPLDDRAQLLVFLYCIEKTFQGISLFECNVIVC
jgi:hypothetical protein